MTSGGVRFKWPDFSDIVRVPREGGGVDITLDGKVIDTIEPPRRKSSPAEIEAFLKRHRELARIVTAHWNDPNMSAVDAVREQRRNLTLDEWVEPDWRPEE